jgi:hypothetical protein
MLSKHAAVESREQSGTMTSIRVVHDEFMHDRRSAEDKYRGKVLTIEAYALSAGASRYSTPIVEGAAESDGETLAIFVLPYDGRIDASFNRLRSVQPGQRLRVSGECRMFSDGDDVLIFKDRSLLDFSGL